MTNNSSVALGMASGLVHENGQKEKSRAPLRGEFLTLLREVLWTAVA